MSSFSPCAFLFFSTRKRGFCFPKFCTCSLPCLVRVSSKREEPGVCTADMSQRLFSFLSFFVSLHTFLSFSSSPLLLREGFFLTLRGVFVLRCIFCGSPRLFGLRCLVVTLRLASPASFSLLRSPSLSAACIFFCPLTVSDVSSPRSRLLCRVFCAVCTPLRTREQGRRSLLSFSCFRAASSVLLREGVRGTRMNYLTKQRTWAEEQTEEAARK
ncbi:hypothetical protein TGVEG_441390 [Toxoplasma gondii VEG]|uniref:Uncharacterized protein n=1 Tax=Toxoplasma gondii (strain ATCC 50861 / VEG) TaxID=432359 RepID=V4ZCF4_TOXGV|nr:hypothetical protein TGVEG_441390 [Toxoplasma gondii VEG]